MNECQDCGTKINYGKFCDRCLAIWYIENDIPDDVPSADFDEPRETC